MATLTASYRTPDAPLPTLNSRLNCRLVISALPVSKHPKSVSSNRQQVHLGAIELVQQSRSTQSPFQRLHHACFDQSLGGCHHFLKGRSSGGRQGLPRVFAYLVAASKARHPGRSVFRSTTHCGSQRLSLKVCEAYLRLRRNGPQVRFLGLDDRFMNRAVLQSVQIRAHRDQTRSNPCTASISVRFCSRFMPAEMYVITEKYRQ
jgi:hypothetical protein